MTCYGSGYATPSADPRGLNLNGMFYGIAKTRIADVTDGTTSTVMVSELLQSPDTGTHDIRGRIWNSIHAGTGFSTLYPPNATVGDNPMGYCVAIPQVPCGSQSTINAFVLARSRHAGGVNAGLADGSVRFVRNTIAQATWQAMGTRNGGEVVSND